MVLGIWNWDLGVDIGDWYVGGIKDWYWGLGIGYRGSELGLAIEIWDWEFGIGSGYWGF